MDKLKKYVILTGGDGGYGNLGDEWLRQAAEYHYSSILKEFKVIMVIAHIPENRDDRFLYVNDNIEAFTKLGVKVEDVAALHYYGGGYLNTFWIKEKLWLYDHLVSQGLSKNRIFFTGQGLGPFDEAGVDRVSRVAQTAGLFGVRDKNFIDSVGGSFMFDESVALINPKKRKPFRLGRKELWVNIRIASHVGADEEEVVSLLKRLKRFSQIYSLNIKYFAMIEGEGFDERAEMIRILKLSGLSEPEVVRRADDYEGLLRQFNKAGMVVTTSYHATLATLYLGLPVIALHENEYYNLKFTGLKEVLDTNLLSLSSIQNCSAENLFSAYESRDKHIVTKLNDLKARLFKAYSRYKRLIGVAEI